MQALEHREASCQSNSGNLTFAFAASKKPRRRNMPFQALEPEGVVVRHALDSQNSLYPFIPLTRDSFTCSEDDEKLLGMLAEKCFYI